MLSHPLTYFETQKYYEKPLNLMVFIQEIIHLQSRMGQM